MLSEKTINLKQLTACYIEKQMYQGDRDCIVKDPTADVLEVVSIVDKSIGRAWNVEWLQLKIVMIPNSDYDTDEPKLIPHYQYLLNDKIREDHCPPKEIDTLLIYTVEQNLDAFYAFLWFCERQSYKYTVAAADAARAAAARAAARAAAVDADAAADAAAVARYAADAAAAAVARYAAVAAARAAAADAAADARVAAAADAAVAAVAAAQVEQILFIRKCLGGLFDE